MANKPSYYRQQYLVKRTWESFDEFLNFGFQQFWIPTILDYSTINGKPHLVVRAHTSSSSISASIS